MKMLSEQKNMFLYLNFTLNQINFNNVYMYLKQKFENSLQIYPKGSQIREIVLTIICVKL